MKLTYLYFKGNAIADTIVLDPVPYMTAIHRIANSGYFRYVSYCGETKTTMGGMAACANRYTIAIIADENTTEKILKEIKYDYSESFPF